MDLNLFKRWVKSYIYSKKIAIKSINPHRDPPENAMCVNIFIIFINNAFDIRNKGHILSKLAMIFFCKF